MSELSSQGYVVARNVLSAGDIDALRASITETIDSVARALRAPFQESFPDVPLENRIDSIAAKNRVYSVALFRAALADSHLDPRMEALAAHPRLTEVVDGLLSPLKRMGQTIRIRASIPALSSARSPWHQDVVRETNQGCGTVRLACWIPLHDVDEHTGALEVIPGEWRAPLPHTEDGEGGRFLIPDEHLPLSKRRTVPVRCGDMLILDRFIPHRSLAPATTANGSARWATVMWVKAV